MGKNLFVGVGGKARHVKALYVGVGGKARKVKKVYVGVGGKARLVYQSYVAVTGMDVTWTKNGAYLTVTVVVKPSSATNQSVSFSFKVGDCGNLGGMALKSTTANSCTIYHSSYSYNEDSSYASGDLTITASDGVTRKLHMSVENRNASNTHIWNVR